MSLLAALLLIGHLPRPDGAILILPSEGESPALGSAVLAALKHPEPEILPGASAACRRGDAACVLQQAQQTGSTVVVHVGHVWTDTASREPSVFLDFYDASGRFARVLCLARPLASCLRNAPGWWSAMNTFTAVKHGSWSQVAMAEDGHGTTLGGVWLEENGVTYSLREPRSDHVVPWTSCAVRIPTREDGAAFARAFPRHAESIALEDTWLVLVDRREASEKNRLFIRLLDLRERDRFLEEVVALHGRAGAVR